MVIKFFRLQVRYNAYLFRFAFKVEPKFFRHITFFLIIAFTLPYFIIRFIFFALGELHFKLRKHFHDAHKAIKLKTGEQIILPLYRSDYIQKVIFSSKSYFELDILVRLKNKYIQPNFVILDIGANIGNHCLYFARQCFAQKVFAFEPLPQTYKMLVENVRVNQLNSVIKTYNLGVSDEEGFAEVAISPKGNIGGTSIKKVEGGNIKLVSIDREFNFERLDFIKIDVETFELFVLNGLIETIKRHKPIILMEIFEKNFEQANQILCNLGYSVYEEFKGFNYLFALT